MTRAIELRDVVNFFEYEKVREERRRKVMDLKRARRVAVGRHLSFLFENRETVLFQIQEMCRAERITDDARIQDEIDAYAGLLPGPDELSATMMIEIEDNERIQQVLDSFLGIDVGRHVFMHVDGIVIPGDFEARHSDLERGKLSAVHFVRFTLPDPAVRGFRTSSVSLVVDHPGERTRAELSPETKAALLVDLES